MGNAELVTKVFLVFLVGKKLLEAWLEHRNKRHIIANRDQVPQRFAEEISLEEHQKAADYTVAKIKSSQVFDFFALIVLLVWTLGGGIDAIAKYVDTLSWGSIYSGAAFFALFGIASSILSLPQGIYTTFVIEEKFGFNKTTVGLFIKDLIKGMIVGAIIGFPILAAILWLVKSLGEGWWIYAWMFLTVVQFFLMWAYPKFIAPLFNKFYPLEDGEVKEKILQLLERTGFTSNGLFVMNASIRSSHGNAYFTGVGKNKRIVFFDTLIENLQAQEIEAVLAHELGHFKKKHITKQLIKSIALSLVGFAILGYLFTWEPFFTGHGVETVNAHTGLLLFAMVGGVYTFFMTPISSKISRKYEFEADEFASKYASGKDLISALVKLYKFNASTLTPDTVYSNFYHSHPPALVRVKHLESLSESPS